VVFIIKLAILYRKIIQYMLYYTILNL